MEPLTSTKRAALLGIAIAIFIVILPVLFLYVSGFRLSQKQGLVETGGIYIHRENIKGVTTISGGSLTTPYVTTDSLSQGFTPTTYRVLFARENFSSWEKDVPVVAGKVTDVHPFQIPLEPEITEIPQKITDENGHLLTNPEYTTTRKLFIPVRDPVSGEITSSPVMKEHTQDKTHIFQFGDSIYGEWTGSENTLPHYFCDAPGVCSLVSAIARGVPTETSFDFFPNRNDIVILAKDDGIYVSEIDRYGGHNESKLISGKNLLFIVKGSVLYIQKDNLFEKINLDW